MVYKRTLRSSVSWCYKFDAPGSTKSKRIRIQEYGFATKKLATEAEAARRILEADKAKAAKPEGITLHALLEEYFADSSHLAVTTTANLRSLAKWYISKDLLNRQISTITAMDLHAEWRRLSESGAKGGKPLAPNTVRAVCGLISSAFRRAQRWGLVIVNPAQASGPPKAQRGKGMALLPAQVNMIVGAAAPWLAAFLSLASATGCRRGELLALEWSDLEDGTLTISRSLAECDGELIVKGTKTNRARQVVLSGSALTALAEHRAAQGEARRHFGSIYEGNLIFAQPDGSKLRPVQVSREVYRLRTRLKLPPGISTHTLRHTHGSQLLAAGVPITDVAARLGHSSAATTARIYSHSLAGADAKAAEAWEKFQKADTVKGVRQ